MSLVSFFHPDMSRSAIRFLRDDGTPYCIECNQDIEHYDCRIPSLCLGCFTDRYHYKGLVVYPLEKEG